MESVDAHPTPAEFRNVTPLLPVRDLEAAVRFYTEKLAFEFVFGDRSGAPGYAGVKRGNLELHLQWQSDAEFSSGKAGPACLRIEVSDIQRLFEEYSAAGVVPAGKQISETPWDTREFWLFDPDGHSLMFYQDL